MNTGTVLDDQRIDDIRTRVMADVDADVRRRGRRARVVAGGAAAAVVAIDRASAHPGLRDVSGPGLRRRRLRLVWRRRDGYPVRI